jgi:transcriptional regulator with XRE-family HTH domain
MKDRLTQFGNKCREFRSRYDLTMGDQAKGLGFSAAYISAIERGKRPVPEDYVAKLAEWLSLTSEDACALRNIASGERTVVKVFPKTREKALLAEDFARDLNGLSPEAVKQLRNVLQSARTGEYSDDELRQKAYAVRAAFSLGTKITFDILRLIENQLPVIDPDFSLQIDPDGSHGENLHIYSDSNGETIDRFVSTEWLYKAADVGTEDSRFKLAHELAHWILHRTQTHTFLRSSRTNQILSKIHKTAEREADFFAREFLMPFPLVREFASPDALAKAAKVPLWLAKNRLREISRLSHNERQNILRIAAEVERAVRDVPADTYKSTSRTSSEVPATAAVLQFQKVSVRRQSPNNKKSAKSQSLPLFDYADAKGCNPETRANRSDQWFSDFGWRG